MTAVEPLALSHRDAEPADAREPVWLARLTDEELVLLGAEHPIVVLPHYEELPPASQDVAVRTAHRSLLARGVEVADDGRALRVPQEVSDLLDVRGGAEWVLVVRRRVTVRDDSWPSGDGGPGGAAPTREVETQLYGHLVDDFVLLEEVDATGQHEFHALDVPALDDVLRGHLEHPDVVDGVGSTITLDLEGIAHGEGDVHLEQLGRVTVQVDATLWRRGPQPAPVLLGLMLGPDGCWASRAVYGAKGPVVLEPVPVSALGELVTSLLGARG
ncbi:hypothetical protein [Luteipulveratus mongoliensis]|uniref:Uncharacterized protein n=1 Tax=Luteipulveratus mongoliensis TaxID=571913 RepID=A0A0K1JIN5_9MICO|nr:hypothetical protein [Luteipulveratus mongoliensis]AKU16443.1 hypothetical protein VV02_12150 [Luteipulveratus mongoliensis]